MSDTFYLIAQRGVSLANRITSANCQFLKIIERGNNSYKAGSYISHLCEKVQNYIRKYKVLTAGIDNTF